MAGRPWFKAFPVDFLDGVRDLSVEEVAAYTVVLMLIYREGGPLRDNSAMISRAIGRDCSMRKWTSLRNRLIEAGKIYLTDDGRIFNRKAAAVLLDGEQEAAARAAAGSKGGEKRAQNLANGVSKAGRKEVENQEKDNENNEARSALLQKPASNSELRTQNSESSMPAGTPSDPAAPEAGPAQATLPGTRVNMPRRNDPHHLWSDLCGGRFEIDERMVRRPIVAGLYFDVVCDAVCKAAKIIDPRWRGDWDAVARWLNAGIASNTIIDAIEDRAARPGYRPPAVLRYFDAVVRGWAQANPGRGKPREAA